MIFSENFINTYFNFLLLLHYNRYRTKKHRLCQKPTKITPSTPSTLQNNLRPMTSPTSEPRRAGYPNSFIPTRFSARAGPPRPERKKPSSRVPPRLRHPSRIPGTRPSPPAMEPYNRLLYKYLYNESLNLLNRNIALFTPASLINEIK